MSASAAETIRVLLVEDDADDYVLTRDLLSGSSDPRVELEWSPTYAKGLEAISRAEHDVVRRRADGANDPLLGRAEPDHGAAAPLPHGGRADSRRHRHHDGRRAMAGKQRRVRKSGIHAAERLRVRRARGDFARAAPRLRRRSGKPRAHPRQSRQRRSSRRTDRSSAEGWRRCRGFVPRGADHRRGRHGHAHARALRRLTERVRLEDELRQAQKMEAIGRLAGRIAHDFNNLLTIVNGFAKVLTGELDPADDRRRYAVEISRAGERGAELTQHLLAFSRKQVLRPTVLEMNEVVEDMAGFLLPLVGEQIEIETLRRGCPRGR